MVQWLKLYASNAGDAGSIPGQGTKIPHTVLCCVCSVVSNSLPPVACKAPLSMEFPRQEYWNGLPFPTLGDLPDRGIEPPSPGLTGGFSSTEPPGKL